MHARPFLMIAVVWLSAFLVRIASGQNSIVVPGACAVREGNRHTTVYFAEQRVRRVQVVVDAAQLQALQGSRLVRLSFRKDADGAPMYGRLRGGEGTPIVVNASFTDSKAASPSPIFRDNHGSHVVEVFRGTVTLPKVATEDDRAVASFDASEAPTIQFTQPLPIVAGKNLCLDFETYPASAGHSWEWPIDAETQRVAGTSQVIGQACWPAKETPATVVMESSLRPGMHIRTTSRTPPHTVAAFLMYGWSDRLAFGHIPLPLTLAAPNCQLLVSPDILVPTVHFNFLHAGNEGHTSQVVPTPQMASLHGASMYMQYLFLVQRSSPSLATGNGLAVTFAKQVPSLGVSLVATTNTTSSSGRVFLDFSPVMQLEAK